MSKFTKYKGEDDGKEQGLQDKPSGPEDGLFVLCKKISSNEQIEKVAVLPDTDKIKASPSSRPLEGSDFLASFDKFSASDKFAGKIRSSLFGGFGGDIPIDSFLQTI